MRENFWEKKTGRKGQVTPFIIIGIVIVVAVVLIVFFGKPRISRPSIVSTAQIDPVRDYVEECIKEKGKDALDLVGRNGGFIEIFEDDRIFLQYKDIPGSFGEENGYYSVKYWCYTSTNENCLSKGFGSNDIEDEISNDVENEINDCLRGVEQFPNVEIDINEKEVDVTIGRYNTIITLDVPIILRKGGAIKIERFSHTFNIALGRFLEATDTLVDAEAAYTYCNVPYTLFNIYYYSESLIKRTSYEGSRVYIIELNREGLADRSYKFQFAVRGCVS